MIHKYHWTMTVFHKSISTFFIIPDKDGFLNPDCR